MTEPFVGTRMHTTKISAFPPGGYGLVGGEWVIRDPRGVIGALRDHQVTEHEDGTITVSPSILYPGGWHGYLERGVWREV